MSILEEEPDLAAGLSREDRELATRVLRARVLLVDRGCWSPPELPPATTYGLLVLEGILLREVDLGPASSAEILGPGDILRPWSDPLLGDEPAATARWQVLHDARVAVLDARVTAAMGHWPELIVTFSDRLVRRARCLAYLLTASHLNRVEDRLLAALWHLGSLWGRRTPAGVVVPIRLTHEHLAKIIGAQRPTVTVALKALTNDGRLARRADRFYVLTAAPPPWQREEAAVRPASDR